MVDPDLGAWTASSPLADALAGTQEASCMARPHCISYSMIARRWTLLKSEGENLYYTSKVCVRDRC